MHETLLHVRGKSLQNLGNENRVGLSSSLMPGKQSKLSGLVGSKEMLFEYDKKNKGDAVKIGQMMPKVRCLNTLPWWARYLNRNNTGLFLRAYLRNHASQGLKWDIIKSFPLYFIKQMCNRTVSLTIRMPKLLLFGNAVGLFSSKSF